MKGHKTVGTKARRDIGRVGGREGGVTSSSESGDIPTASPPSPHLFILSERSGQGAGRGRGQGAGGRGQGAGREGAEAGKEVRGRQAERREVERQAGREERGKEAEGKRGIKEKGDLCQASRLLLLLQKEFYPRLPECPESPPNTLNQANFSSGQSVGWTIVLK